MDTSPRNVNPYSVSTPSTSSLSLYANDSTRRPFSENALFWALIFAFSSSVIGFTPSLYLTLTHLSSSTYTAPLVSMVGTPWSRYFVLISFLSESNGTSSILSMQSLSTSSFRLHFTVSAGTEIPVPSVSMPGIMWTWRNISSNAYSVGSPIPLPSTMLESLVRTASYSRYLWSWLWESSSSGL